MAMKSQLGKVQRGSGKGWGGKVCVYSGTAQKASVNCSRGGSGEGRNRCEVGEDACW